ncbi:MAG: putative cytokinetic ring protein SteA [Bacillota bacterium]|nr:putative cytokinetic ring protein SteA [Bacillota bacterium]
MIKKVRGIARKDTKTKDLIKRINPGEIAVINHENIDEVAAQGLIAKKIKAVINISHSIEGNYPNTGPLLLVDAGIVLIDNCQRDLFTKINEGDPLIIVNNLIYCQNRLLAVGENLTRSNILTKMNKTKENLEHQLSDFIQNTIEYASKEQNIVVANIDYPKTVPMTNRHVLIAVRGKDYEEDLRILTPYIKEENPVIIAVDGAADALLKCGYKPHLIIGDMDSVSDMALMGGSQIIVHAYTNGHAPGLARLEKLGIKPDVVAAPGTSEDVAMLLAYEKGAELIVAVGTHSNMIDFLEKGRKGMASTFLVRLKVGAILIDAKGVSKLYRHRVKVRYLAEIVAAALIPVTLISVISPYTYQFFRLIMLKIKLLLNV